LPQTSQTLATMASLDVPIIGVTRFRATREV
jgi:hypothetical protein